MSVARATWNDISKELIRTRSNKGSDYVSTAVRSAFFVIKDATATVTTTAAAAADENGRENVFNEETEDEKYINAVFNEKHFCCANGCVEEPRTVVDGRACDKCDSFGYCTCACINTKRKQLLRELKNRVYDKSNDNLSVEHTYEEISDPTITAKSYVPCYSTAATQIGTTTMARIDTADECKRKCEQQHAWARNKRTDTPYMEVKRSDELSKTQSQMTTVSSLGSLSLTTSTASVESSPDNRPELSSFSRRLALLAKEYRQNMLEDTRRRCDSISGDGGSINVVSTTTTAAATKRNDKPNDGATDAADSHEEMLTFSAAVRNTLFARRST